VGAHAPATTHIVLDAPLAGVPGHQRAGLRAILARELTAHSLGAVLSTDSPVDALVLDARIIELDAEQVAQEGDVTTILGKPRGGLSAALGGANVMSGLARRGWLSIGHSQVRRRTELDGPVYLAIPTDAVTLSVDEFDPAFRGEFVFETIVIGVRDDGDALQVRLSPVDNEAGLPLVVDVLDASPRRAWAAITPDQGGEPQRADQPGDGQPSRTDRPGAPAQPAPASGTWAVLHPGLGPDLATQLSRIGMGSRLWAEVDTQRIHVWSVEV
jgi:ABC-type Fe3+/spermidine/putrescine transport system ATPase subunit